MDSIEAYHFYDGTVLTQQNLLDRQGFYIHRGTDSNDYISQGVGRDDMVLAGEGDDLVNSGNGNDALYGGSGNDSLSSDAGDDHLYGGSGDDTYYFELGDGADQVYETINAGNDILHFGEGISSEDVELHVNIDTGIYELRYSETDLIRFGTHSSNSEGSMDSIEAYRFDAGTVLTQQDLLDRQGGYIHRGTDGDDTINQSTSHVDVVYGGAGNDSLSTYAGDDHLYGGTGDDTLLGGSGDDTYYFELGDGADQVYETINAGNDILHFGEGISSEDVELHVNIDTGIYELRYSETDLIRFGTHSSNSEGSMDSIEAYRFDAGTVLTQQDLLDRQGGYIHRGTDGDDTINQSTSHVDVVYGGAGNDSLSTYAGDDHLYGGSGDDTLFGGSGDDTYYFELGDGVDLVYESSNGGNNALFFRGGISINDLNLFIDSSGFYQIQYSATDIVRFGSNSSTSLATINTIDRIIFDDGSIYEIATLPVLNGDPGVFEYSGITVASEVPDQSVDEDTAFNFIVPAGTFIDPESDPLSYSASLANGDSLPAWLSFDPITQAFSGTPGNSDTGILALRVYAADGNGSQAFDEFSLTINNTNDAPTVANAITDQVASEDAAFSFVVPADAFADADVGDSLTLSATLSDGSPLPTWLSFDAVTNTFSGTPTNAEVGAISVTVTATDGSSASVIDTFALTVNNTNDTPTVANAITDQVTSEDAAFSFVVPVDAFADVDAGDSLTLSATLSDGSPLPTWLSFDAVTNTFSGTPNNGEVGALNITVTATDGSAASVSDTFALTVNNTNDAPTVSTPIVDQVANEDAAFNFTVPVDAFADTDVGDSLTLSATLSDGSALPTWLSFDAITNTFSGTPANGEVGSINVMVTATDGSAASVSDTFSLTVNNTNDAPTVANAITDQVASEDAAFNFTVSVDAFADTDVGDSLTLSATLSDGSPLPTWLSFDALTNTFSGTPNNGEVGALNITVTATDGSAVSVSDTFALTVNNTNDTPTVANAITDQVTSEDAAFSFVVPVDAFADVDAGDSLTLSATLSDGSPLPTWLSFDAVTNTFSGTPNNGEVGALNITVTATDGSSASVIDTFALTVNNTNDAPTVSTPIVDQVANEDAAFNFTVPVDAFADTDVG